MARGCLASGALCLVGGLWAGCAEPPEAGGEAVASAALSAGDSALPAPSCALYCALVEARCARAPTMVAVLSDCPAACAALPPGGAVGDLTGDSLGCRLTYLLMATGTGDADLCRPAAPDGGLLCTDAAAGGEEGQR